MILETLDVKRHDIFIYSENKLSLKSNFKLINKDSADKNPQGITYNKVCEYIEHDVPKNLIVYRLLTNLPSYDITNFKYGFPMVINGEKEIVHFDPCFAIQDLEDYVKEIEFKFLRFRIQQVGLIYYMRSFGKVNYSEVYSFDMEANEAKWQNDRVFAELIFAFDEIDFNNVSVPEKKTIADFPESKPIYTRINTGVSDIDFEVDKQYNPVDTKKLTVQGSSRTTKRIEIVKPGTFDRMFTNEVDTKAEVIKPAPSAFSSFLDRVKKSTVVEEGEIPSGVVNQSANQFKDFVKNRQKEQFVLRFKGK
jgi:hypothetical protein